MDPRDSFEELRVLRDGQYTLAVKHTFLEIVKLRPRGTRPSSDSELEAPLPALDSETGAWRLAIRVALPARAATSAKGSEGELDGTAATTATDLSTTSTTSTSTSTTESKVICVRRGASDEWRNAPCGVSSGDEGASASMEDSEEGSEDRGAADSPVATSVATARRRRRSHQKEPTTIMLRNLPNNYTRDMLLSMLDSKGFKGKYDFIYLPIDFTSQAGLGYAFINVLTPNLVQDFWRTFDGFSDWLIPTNKVCQVDWSVPLQGLQAHLDRYRNSPVMHSTLPDEFKPMLFVNGQRVTFPPPTKLIKLPGNRN